MSYRVHVATRQERRVQRHLDVVVDLVHDPVVASTR